MMLLETNLHCRPTTRQALNALRIASGDDEATEEIERLRETVRCAEKVSIGLQLKIDELAGGKVLGDARIIQLEESLRESERQLNLAVGKISVMQHFEEYRQGKEDGDLEEYKVRTDLLQATFSACSIQDKAVREQLEARIVDLQANLVIDNEQHRVILDAKNVERQEVITNMRNIWEMNKVIQRRFDLAIANKNAQMKEEAQKAQTTKSMLNTWADKAEKYVKHLERKIQRRDEDIQRLTTEVLVLKATRSSGAELVVTDMTKVEESAIASPKLVGIPQGEVHHAPSNEDPDSSALPPPAKRRRIEEKPKPEGDECACGGPIAETKAELQRLVGIRYDAVVALQTRLGVSDDRILAVADLTRPEKRNSARAQELLLEGQLCRNKPHLNNAAMLILGAVYITHREYVFESHLPDNNNAYWISLGIRGTNWPKSRRATALKELGLV